MWSHFFEGITVNWFDDRPKHPDFTQPVDLMYRKPDPVTKAYSAASDRVHIYNVSITKFMEKFLGRLAIKCEAQFHCDPGLHYIRACAGIRIML